MLRPALPLLPGAVLAALLLVAPASPAQPGSTARGAGAAPALQAAPPNGDGSDARFTDALLDSLNQYRSSQGLGSLQPDPGLQLIAAGHSQALAQQGRLSHGGFEQRLDRSGARFCVENLAAGFARPAAMLAAWQRSEEHHRNLLEPQVQRIGLARHQGMVAMLACSADAAPLSSARPGQIPAR